MKEIIKKLMPKKIENKFRLIKESRALNKLSIQYCIVENLRFTDRNELTEIFNNQSIERNWNSSKEKIDLLELPEMAGGVNPGDQQAIFYLVNYLRPKNILEIGTHIGCSTLNIALALNSSDDSKITTVDIVDVNDENVKRWLAFGSKCSPQELLSKIGFKNGVEFIKMSSTDYLKRADKKFDFIFLDGSHAASVVYQEIPLAMNLLNPNGIILLHDYFPNNKPLWNNNSLIPGPYLAVQRLKEENNSFDVLSLGELPWKTKLNSNITSLAIVSSKKTMHNK